MVKTEKICPLILVGHISNGILFDEKDIECLQGKCAFFISGVYSTEGIAQRGRCAIKFIAEKNSDGKLPV